MLSFAFAVIVDGVIGFFIAWELQSLHGGGDIGGMIALSVAVLVAGPTGAVFGVLSLCGEPRGLGE